MNFTLRDLPMPLLIIPPQPMDDESLMEFCGANDFYKIERTNKGELRVMTPAGGGTGSRNAEIIGQLWKWTREDGRGVHFDSNTGFSLPDGSMLSPDAAWISRVRWQALTEAEQARYSPICPEFVIELRSKSDRLKDVEDKMGLWIANGAEVAWLIDPTDRAVTIYRPDDAPERLFDPTSVQGTGPIAGFELIMSWVWDVS